MEHGLKAGMYKIKSVLDGNVLTAFAEGCPQVVKTVASDESDGQKWKVKVRKIGDENVQLIRNPAIKNNEVSKKSSATCCEPNGDDEMGPANWHFTPVPGHENTFKLNNGSGFLTNPGKDARVKFENAAATDDSQDSQQWTFEWLSEVVKE